MLRIKTLLYEERLTLEGAKKRLRQRGAQRTDQMDLGLKSATLEAALRRTRDRLQRLRERLAAARTAVRLEFRPPLPVQSSGRGVAQPGSALDWGSRGRWFKSSRPDQFHQIRRADSRICSFFAAGARRPMAP